MLVLQAKNLGLEQTRVDFLEDWFNSNFSTKKCDQTISP